jgi:hypothetical protein
MGKHMRREANRAENACPFLLSKTPYLRIE